jgi:hypothetical protein
MIHDKFTYLLTACAPPTHAHILDSICTYMLSSVHNNMICLDKPSTHKYYQIARSDIQEDSSTARRSTTTRYPLSGTLTSRGIPAHDVEPAM